MTGHYRFECKHGHSAGQCRCPSTDKPVHLVPCEQVKDHPPTVAPTGPTAHLETAEYWRGLYNDAVAAGQAALIAVRTQHFSVRRDGPPRCAEDLQPWPCRTISAIEEAMK